MTKIQQEFPLPIYILQSPHAACMNFVNALEKIPGIIAQYEERTAKLKADVPILEAIMSKMWGKEDELKQLKSELAALDRKITAELAPIHEVPDDQKGVNQDEKDGTDVKQETTSDAVTIQPNNAEHEHNPSLVAEPKPIYQKPNHSQSFRKP